MSAPQRSASGQPRHHDRRLLVLRHGITEHNAAGIWQGHLDTELSMLGRDQALAAGEALAAYRPVLLVTSDLRRAAQTAEALASRIGVPARHDERLREIHVGQWQGLSSADVDERHPDVGSAIARGEDLRRGIDGETVAEVVERARAAVVELIEALADGDTAVVVTHGVTARALVADLVGMDQRTAWLSLSGLGNCHWGELREYDGRWRLWGWNHHAEAADRSAQTAY